MRLVSPEAVVATVGVALNPGSSANAGQALDLSYPILENLLETAFAQATVSDFYDTISGSLRFRTTNTFVDMDTLIVRASSDGTPLLQPTDGVVLPTDAYTFDPVGGVIEILNPVRKGQRQISISYDSGLPTTDTDENVLDAPQWLQECSVAIAVHILNTFPSSPANRKDKTVVNVSAEIRHLASLLINSRKRPRMTVTFPAHTLTDA